MGTFPDTEYDLFGDGTILLIPMYGHSAGMTAVKVYNGKDYVIIAGDCGYGRPSWEEQILPGVEWNRSEAKRSLEKLRQYGIDPQCQAVLMTHDPEHTAGIIEL